MSFRSSLVALSILPALLSTYAEAQLTYSEIEAVARVESSVTDSKTFDFTLDEDERMLMTEGVLSGELTSFAGANGGSANASSTYDISVSSNGLLFVAELASQSTLGGALNVNASSGAAIVSALSPLGQTDVAISGSFILDQPLPTGFAGPAFVDVRVQLLGASASNPGVFVNIQSELSSFGAGTENEVRFIDTATLFPDGDYSLLVQASLIAGQTSGSINTPVEISGRFTMRLDYLDSDQDGLFDTWETDGIDFELDGIPELDLPGMGATPDNKDLFVEIDVHSSTTLTQDTLEDIVNAFDNAPVSNPSGVDGIFLHMDIDETDLPDRNYFEDLSGGSGNIRVQMRNQRASFFGTAAQRSSSDPEVILKAKSLVYRYGVVGGILTVTFDGGSISPGGMAELPGDDFIITLINPNPRQGDQGRTIMHELGHTLGLRHGGNDNVNYKPNYFSVMNYMHALQRPAWGPDWNNDLPFDYSRSKLPDVDEFDLSESAGIGSDCACTAGRLFAFGNDNPISPQSNNPVFIGQAGPGDSVDWDVDGSFSTEGFVLDVNRLNPTASPNIEVHQGHDDWSNLYYKLRGGRNFDFGAVATGESTLDPEIGEFSFEENEELNNRPVVYLDDPGPSCVPDLNMDGNLNFFDVADYIALYNADDLAADFAAPFGTLNFFDVAEYIAAFNAGCP